MFADMSSLSEFDPELSAAMDDESRRQEEHVELIASENYASPRVMEAQGSVLTNKYAEGYPGKRYYGGCEYVDVAEQLAIDRAKQLFNADYANVQPHSGSQANAAVFFALLNPGDTILGMSLSDGGHLTHGSPVNFSGKLFNAHQYGVNPDTGELDYEQVQALADEHKPQMIIAGFSAHSRSTRLGTFSRNSGQLRRVFRSGHGACRRAGGDRPLSVTFAVCRCRNVHHAQDAARPTRRHHPGEGERRINEEVQLAGLPRYAGRSAYACDCCQGSRVPGSTGSGVQ